MASQDELAQTATAPAPPAAPRGPRETLGRFRIERELGTGGMGVVYAAFDPELERKVALKVLHHADDPEARTRLLREARAMAKLSHPNVIVVYEVGSVGGEDFIAMELIDGGTLGEWLTTRPRARDVIAAFTAAARGLAAAHAEGLVHRDFKPNNVLRGKSGRIVVTDFGLARDEAAEPVPTGGAAADSATTSSLLTRTGALVGTPAYMAPEQWTGAQVTAASDQFAFCVALWEALAGIRPFGGDTLDELRRGVLAGPARLDATRIPRPLRAPLRRGLATDAAQRWPSIAALLEAIERTTARRHAFALTAGGIALVAAAAVTFAVTRPSGSSCAPPARDPDELATRPAAREPLARWRTTREQACHAPRDVRSAQLACLDGVLARVADATARGPSDPEALAMELVDPEACTRTPTPHLLAPIDPAMSDGFVALRTAATTGTADGLDGVLAATSPCVRTLGLLAKLARVDRDVMVPTDASKLIGIVEDLRVSSERCEDDAIRTTAIVVLGEPGKPDSVKRVEAAVAQLHLEAFDGMLAALHAEVASQAGRIDEAIDLYERARQLEARAGRTYSEQDDALHLARTRLARSTPADLDAVVALAAQYRDAPTLVGLAAQARWRRGDIAAADADARTAHYRYPASAFIDAQMPAADVTGEVVDEAGAPVAGAKVAASMMLFGDAAETASPLLQLATASETTTDAHGAFHLPSARGSIVAVHGDRMSLPVLGAPHVTLRLGPTTRIRGEVALGDVPPTTLRVMARIESDHAAMLRFAPLEPGGRFTLDGIPPGKVHVAITAYDQWNADDEQEVMVPPTGVTDLHLEASAGGKLHVIARSETTTVFDMAVIFVFAGHHPLKGTARELFRQLGGPRRTTTASPADPATVAAPLRGHVEADDLVGEISPRPKGELTLCAIGLTKKLLGTATTTEKMQDLVTDMPMECTTALPTDERVVVSVPPMPRRKL